MTTPLPQRWLAAWKAWNQAGRPENLKPPDFGSLRTDRERFAERLDELERELAAPDMPAARSG